MYYSCLPLREVYGEAPSCISSRSLSRLSLGPRGIELEVELDPCEASEEFPSDIKLGRFLLFVVVVVLAVLSMGVYLGVMGVTKTGIEDDDAGAGMGAGIVVVVVAAGSKARLMAC
jgi:hypothetical protein